MGFEQNLTETGINVRTGINDRLSPFLLFPTGLYGVSALTFSPFLLKKMRIVDKARLKTGRSLPD